MKIRRRQFWSTTVVAGLAWQSRWTAAADTSGLETLVPCRAITRGPAYHWFGYYDKREFDPTNTLVLSNKVSFEGRSPTAADSITVGFINTKANDAWTPIGSCNAWGWQQGCMLQWVGDSGKQVLWNDRLGDSFGCRIHDVETGRTRTLPRPIYTISPDGRYGLSTDFRRIDNLRPGYGYDGLADPFVAQRAPEESGVWRVDLKTGRDELILSLADVASIPWADGDRHASAWHYFNHLLVSPDSQRFIVLHRYRPVFDPKTLQFHGGFVTRMLTAAIDGSDRFILDPSGFTSHFIWKDNEVVTMWTKPDGRPAGFYDFVDKTDRIKPVGPDTMPVNGHNTYLPPPYQDWILNDTYPAGPQRRQTVYLYHVPSGRRFDLGHFPAPAEYRGEWRCDTHPRSSNDGTTIAIDSPHAGGRQVYLLDIAELLRRES